MIEQQIFTEVNFEGPFFWVSEPGKTSIVDSESCIKSGVYFWTISYQEKELVYYIGQTGRGFYFRLAEHFFQHASGGYHLYEPGGFLRGEKVQVWAGRYDANQRTTIPEFLEHYEELAPVVKRLAGIYRFWVAPMECEKRLRERFEAALSIHLRKQPGVVGAFQDQGVRYNYRWDSEQPLNARILNHSQFHGLPSSLSF